MTYEELLLEIQTCFGEDYEKWMETKSNALRAVVELHKPFTREDGLTICDLACNDEGGYFESYPCSTIQAIEKALQ